jgi:hypothetical protein
MLPVNIEIENHQKYNLKLLIQTILAGIKKEIKPSNIDISTHIQRLILSSVYFSRFLYICRIIAALQHNSNYCLKTILTFSLNFLRLIVVYLLKQKI